MRWFLIFLLILLEIIILILILPVGVKLEASNESLVLYAKILGINIKVFPKEKKKTAKSKQRKKTDKPKTEKPAEEKPKSKLTFDRIMEYMSFVSDALTWAVSGIYIRRFNLSAVIHNDDAARTALIYGSVCSGLGIIVPKLEKIFKVKNSDISVYPGFDSGNSFELKMSVMAVPIQLIFIAAVLYIKWNKLQKKDKVVQK